MGYLSQLATGFRKRALNPHKIIKSGQIQIPVYVTGATDLHFTNPLK
jgi:hypothetical protein